MSERANREDALNACEAMAYEFRQAHTLGGCCDTATRDVFANRDLLLHLLMWVVHGRCLDYPYALGESKDTTRLLTSFRAVSIAFRNAANVLLSRDTHILPPPELSMVKKHGELAARFFAAAKEASARAAEERKEASKMVKSYRGRIATMRRAIAKMELDLPAMRKQCKSLKRKLEVTKRQREKLIHNGKVADRFTREGTFNGKMRKVIRAGPHPTTCDSYSSDEVDDEQHDEHDEHDE